MSLSPDQTIELINRVAKIDANLETLSHRLLGNGQPGEVDRLDGRLSAIEDYVVAAKTRSVMLGAAGGAIVTAAVFILKLVLKV